MRKLLLSIFFLFLLTSDNVVKAQYGNYWVSDNFTETKAGFSMGYVRGQLRSHIDDYCVFDNGFWDHREDQGLNGFSMGFMFQQHLGGSGFSLYEGINTELYFSKNDPIETDAEILTSPNEIWTNYFEWTLNIPLHLQFSITMPFDELFTIGFHTGPGYTLTLMGKYSDNRNLYPTYNMFDGDLKRSNITYDLGVFFQHGYLRLELVWSRGLSCIQSHDGMDLYRNKFTASLAIMF